MRNKKIRKYLKRIIENEEDSIRKEVAREALRYSSSEIKHFFSDLLQYGCQSGMVSSLIYYVDTHVFFHYYYEEIEELCYDYEEMTGMPLTVKGDLMNWYAWFAFEETARKIAEELQLEI